MSISGQSGVTIAAKGNMVQVTFTDLESLANVLKINDLAFWICNGERDQEFEINFLNQGVNTVYVNGAKIKSNQSIEILVKQFPFVFTIEFILQMDYNGSDESLVYIYPNFKGVAVAVTDDKSLTFRLTVENLSFWQRDGKLIFMTEDEDTASVEGVTIRPYSPYEISIKQFPCSFQVELTNQD
ncbi:MAG: hypothetical protein OHK0017_05330 [Patescibacteria group bacterium]